MITFLMIGCSEKKEPEKNETKITLEEVKQEARKEPQPTVALTQNNGEVVYKRACIACHLNGVAGAPKLDDEVAWEPRIKKGEKLLFENVWNGYKAMPSRGGCGDCSEQDIKDAITYMISTSK
jgi:cytochrome c5